MDKMQPDRPQERRGRMGDKEQVFTPKLSGKFAEFFNVDGLQVKDLKFTFQEIVHLNRFKDYLSCNESLDVLPRHPDGSLYAEHVRSIGTLVALRQDAQEAKRALERDEMDDGSGYGRDGDSRRFVSPHAKTSTPRPKAVKEAKPYDFRELESIAQELRESPRAYVPKSKRKIIEREEQSQKVKRVFK